MIQTLLDLDASLLLSAGSLAGPERARLISICGELIVLYGMLVLVSLWLLGVYRKTNTPKLSALEIFTTIILTFGLYAIINLGVPQWRIGAMELTGATALIPHPIDNSFPSGHALFTAALIVGLWNFSRKWSLIGGAIVFGLITASARVIGGVHYPGDILGGWLFGAIGACI